jgi:KUP system potassium uptake protein
MGQQMGYVPYQHRYTSHEEHGQIYISNQHTARRVHALVIGFRAATPGKRLWDRGDQHHGRHNTYFSPLAGREMSIQRAAALCALLLAVEGTFLAANAAKVTQGGWLPLAIGAAVFLLMTTWKRGRYLLRKNSLQMLSLRDLIVSTTALGRESGLPARVPGTAMFLAGQPKGAPVPLLHNLKHNRVLHERNIVLTIITDRIPYVKKDSRIEPCKISHTVFPESSPLWLYGNTDNW